MTNDRVLVKDQTAGAENGIYVVDTGTWTRAADWDGAYDVGEGTLVYVTDGTVAAGVFYAVTTADPITIGTTSVALAVGTVSVSFLSASTGASKVGFAASGSGAGDRTAQDKMREFVSVKDFEVSPGVLVAGDGVQDDTVGIQAAIDAANTATTSFTPTNGAAIGYGPAVLFPPGRYKITSAITYYGYTKLVGLGQPIIEQTTAAATHFTSASVFDNEVVGLKFIGGNRAFYIENPNVDYTRFRFVRCEFQATADYAVYSFGTGDIQISGDLTFDRCGFLNCNKVLRNAFDECSFDGRVEITNSTTMTANTALFYNAEGNLRFNRLVGIPNVGDVGAGRPATVRWIDHYGSGIYAEESRFGGESAGMPIVYNFAPLNQAYPWLGSVISLKDCLLASGPLAAADSSVINVQTEVPQFVNIENCNYPADVPLIFNGGALTLATYFAAQHANIVFRFRVAPNMTRGVPALADEFKPYVQWQDQDKQSSAIPTAGTYERGMVLWNSAPSSDGNIGWVCVTAGTPGTWRPFGAIGSNATQPASWQAPTLQNSWANIGVGNNAGYLIDAAGFVHLRGNLNTGTIGLEIFTLAAGYRPAAQENLSAFSAASGPTQALAWVQISTAGVVTAVAGSNNQFCLDGLTFKAA